MKTFNHSTRTRERVNPASSANVTGRAKRRAEHREMRKAMASTAQHDPRAVKFHF